jgi:sulfur-carrier protein
MKIRLRFFASLREAFGNGEVLDTADVGHPATVAELRSALAARGGRWHDLLGPSRLVRAALDQQMCADSSALVDNAEVAFFPPVTGG